MKKYFLIAVAALFALPMLNSCGGPSGDAKGDAEIIGDYYEKERKLTVEILEKKLEMAEYYADQNDYKGYKKFLEKIDKLSSKVDKDFEKEHKDEIKDLKKRMEKAEKKLRKKKDKDDD